MECGESMILPYLPSTAMMRGYVRQRLEGDSRIRVWRGLLGSLRPRDLTRREIAGAHGQRPVLLTVPIKGGAGIVKRGHPECWTLSDHGRWRMMHLGAMEAAYGAAPYFDHFYPAIRSVITEAHEGMPVADFTSRLYTSLEDILGLESIIEYLRNMNDAEYQRVMVYAREKTVVEYADLSFLDVIFRKGLESIFTLLGDSDC
ncbi:MAG: WbqC family protein [Muribaculaceae bacterium]|nr:WbqC family protein [Muribaculaceae bacterium]